jgi:transketolase
MNVLQMMEVANARDVYGTKLAELGAVHEEIVVLTADLMNSNKLGDFKKVFPERFFNVGIAEANMMGIGAGLALEGKVPFVSTFATFASMRACEQVRTDIAYPNLPVKIIATVGGLSGGTMGPTHQGMEDMGIMRMMPNMTVIAPGDPLQMSQFIQQAYELPGPVYIRLGRGNDPVIYGDDQVLEVGKAITAREGSDVTIISCGTIMRDALRAAASLEEDGISARVVDMHTIKPLDAAAVIKAAEETGHIVTAEDHTIIGGLGSAVAEVLAEAGIPCRFKRLGVPDVFALVGPPGQLYRHYGFDWEGIDAIARTLLRR